MHAMMHNIVVCRSLVPVLALKR